MTSEPHESQKAWSPSFLEVTTAASIVLASAKCGDEKPAMEDEGELGSYESMITSIAPTEIREAQTCTGTGDFAGLCVHVRFSRSRRLWNLSLRYLPYENFWLTRLG